jgi:RNA polymerase sigma-70 factor (ECF subfamily)
MSKPTDVVRFIELAKGGDIHALGSLLEGYRAYLGMLSWMQVGRRLRSKFDIDDVIQETFLHAHRAIGRFRGASEEEFLAWLRGILAHVIASQVRRYCSTERRDPKLERSLELGLERSSEGLLRMLAAPGSSPSQQVVRHERAVRLAEAMDRLPAATREVLLLRHFQDLGFPEIARKMERTLDSVKNLWIRALARLRRELDVLDDRS